MKRILLETNESGDWARVYVDGKLFDEGHSISDNTWLRLIASLGHATEELELPDEDFG